ncbi:DUF4198 domain-containing protein [Nevskia ramosa]|uniref:DUF4198 domain-containing protein n=1 Tax=Nevskia ramosa TaxID=64002 RepID=UPI002352D5E1|nr:DUF4198 domain-containing protein [Nevskia ramosa]
MNHLTAATLGFATALASWSFEADAHDYWLEFSPASQGQIALHLYVGECLEMDEERVYQPALTEAFTGYRNGKARDLSSLATPDANPLARFAIGDKTLPSLIVFERGWSYIELDAEKFEGYLKDEGFVDAIAERKVRKESRLPGRERYRRHLKALVPGAPQEAIDTSPIGKRLELVPLEAPAGLKAGDTVAVRLLFDGRALAEAPVEVCQRQPDSKVSIGRAITDDDGVARLPIAQSGMTLIRAVQMRRVTDQDSKADWESFWTSYSLIVP